MTAPGFELATEWVTILPETATLAKRLREFKPAPIRVDIEADTDEMERRSREGGRRSGRSIDTEVKRETRGTGKAVGDNIAEGMNERAVTAAAERLGRNIRLSVEKEARKINLRSVVGGLTSGLGVAASGTMQLLRNVGTLATVLKYAAKFARGLSISMLAAGTATRVLSAGVFAKLGSVLGIAAKGANVLATQVARVTSALLVAASIGKGLTFLYKFGKIAGTATLGLGALIGLGTAGIQVFSQWGSVAVGALTAIGAAAGIAAGAAAGLLGPAIGVAKLAMSGLSDAAKEFNKNFKDSDELFNKNLGEKLGPLLTAFHDLKQAVTTAFADTLMPGFKSLTNSVNILKPDLTDLAGILGGVGSALAGALESKVVDGTISRMIKASGTFVSSLTTGLSGLSTGVIDFVTTAATAFSGTGQSLNDMLLKLGDFLRGISADEMKNTFAVIKAQITNVWNLVKPFLQAVKAIGAETAPALAPGFKAVGEAIKQATPGLVNMAKILMPALSKVMEALAPILPSLVASFTPWAKVLAVIAPAIAQVVGWIAPFAPALVAIVAAVKAATIAMALYNTAMLLYANYTKIATAAQWLWNTAFAASGIGTVIVVLVAAGVALWAFFTKTEAGRKLWEKIWPAIKNAALTAWNAIKEAFTKAWTYMQPIFQKIGELAKVAWDKFKSAAETVWPVLQKVIGFLANLWLTVGKFNFTVVIGALKMFGSVAATVFDAIKTAVVFTWQNVLQPTFTAIAAAWKVLWFALQVGGEAGKVVFDAIKDVVLAVWHNVFEPAFEAIGKVVQVAWSIMGGIFDLIKGGISAIGEVVTWLWHTIFEPAWEAIKAGWDVLWKYLSPIFDVFKSGMQGIGDIATKIADGIKSAWGGLKQVFLAPLHALGTFLAGVPTKILGIEVPFVADIQKWGANLQGLAGGGIIKGPGTGTSDSILGLDKSGVPTARVSAGEGIVPEKALSTPLGKLLFAELIHLPGLAGGGQVPGGRGDGLNPGAAWLKDYVMKNYGVAEVGGRKSEDGFGEHSSGNAIDIMVGSDTALGNQIAGFLKSNKDALGLNGMIWQQRSYGYGGGWDGKMMSDRGSPTQNHMDHIHAILGSGRGVGAAAVGLPTGPIIDNVTGASTSPGSAGGTSLMSADGSGSGRMVVDPKKVREAEDRVTDKTNSLDVANTRLRELQAKGSKVSGSTLDAAQNTVDKLTRDVEQAKSDLEEAKQGTFKADPKSKSSSGGGSDDWSSVGGMIFSGFLESFGLDGSVFKNLLDTPNVKSGMALANFGLSLLGGGDDAAAGQGNGSNGLGLLGGGDGSSGILGVGTELLAGIGDQAGVNLAPAGTPASGVGTGPAPGPTFDLRGSQLGVSPGAFDDKMGEMTAASKRFPTLGP